MNKQQRLEHANQLIRVIGKHGRQFFFNKNTGMVARLELDKRGRVWFVDDYRGAMVYTDKVMGYPHRWRGFSHGGTMRSLVEALRDYIKHGTLLDKWRIATGRFNLDDGDIWGYGTEAAKAVREEAFKLPMFE